MWLETCGWAGRRRIFGFPPRDHHLACIALDRCQHAARAARGQCHAGQAVGSTLTTPTTPELRADALHASHNTREAKQQRGIAICLGMLAAGCWAYAARPQTSVRHTFSEYKAWRFAVQELLQMAFVITAWNMPHATCTPLDARPK